MSSPAPLTWSAMAKRITVTALKPVQYDGRSHVRGSVFTTTPIDAASLKYRGKVKLGGQLSGATVPEHPSITQRMEPVKGFEPDPDTPDPSTPAHEAPVEPGKQPAEPSTSQRARRVSGSRTYQRRDMVAEDPNT